MFVSGIKISGAHAGALIQSISDKTKQEKALDASLADKRPRCQVGRNGYLPL